MANEFNTLLELAVNKTMENFDYVSEIDNIQKKLFRCISENGSLACISSEYSNVSITKNLKSILELMGYIVQTSSTGKFLYVSLPEDLVLKKIKKKIEFGDSCNDMLTSNNNNDFEEEVNKEFLRLEEIFKHYYSIKDIDISLPYEVSFDYYDGDFVLALFDKLNKVGYGGNIICSYNSGSNCFKYSLKINLENIYYILRKEGKVKTLSYRQLPNGEIDC